MIIELYRFSVGSEVFGYTNHAEEVDYNGQIYEPAYVRRDSIKGTEQIARSGIKVRLARDAGIAALYVGTPPTQVGQLDLYQQNDANTFLIWTGRLMAPERSGSEVIFNCEPIFTSLKRAGLRAHYQTSCRHALYDHNCTVIRDSRRTDATVTAVNGNKITAAEFGALASGFLTSGYLEYGNGPVLRSIVEHAGDTITLDSPLAIEIGETVRVFDGCDHLFATCRDKFNNEENFGGFPFIPRINPFGDTPIF
jgi:uncharacterized phage protein (TIGR02218 family)